MSKQLKSVMVEGYRRELDGVTSCVLLDVSPLAVGDVEGFRRHLREHDVRLRVLRNRLAHRAVEGTALEPIRPMFRGPTAIAFDRGDMEGVATVKVIKSYLRRRRGLRVAVKGGLSEGTALDASGVEALANTPDRPQLQAILMGTIQGPARALAAAVAGVMGGLARALQARIEEEGGGDG